MYAHAHAAARPAVGFPRAASDPAHARLNWLIAAEAEAERRASRFRTPREEEEMLLMRRPVHTEAAFRHFGLLLGTLPPAAIFLRLNYFFLSKSDDDFGRQFLAISVVMLAACVFVGRFMGGRVGAALIADTRRRTLTKTILLTLVAAFVWAAATGAAGGVFFYVFGMYFGVACALAVALPAFTVFVLLHRPLARGGMIDARHLRPLSWGVAATFAALILGL